ncbi:hypothetical protein [Paenibacillus sp. FSL K6-2862]|uniref:hypothetical protein n=1 Tax=Paenibacillus sp. FSL K6-2862 TaxID=2921484 RepID=UPI0030FA95CB
MDHNHGKGARGQYYAGYDCGAALTTDSVITFYSEGYDQKYVIDLTDLATKAGDGMAAGFGAWLKWCRGTRT